MNMEPSGPSHGTFIAWKKIGISNVCRICLTFDGYCGLYAVNSKSKQLIFEIFKLTIDDSTNWKICVECLNFIEKVARFKDMAMYSDHVIGDYLEGSAQEVPRVSKETSEEKKDEDGVNEQSMDETLMSETSIEEEPLQAHAEFPCDLCSKSYKFKKGLLKHQRIVHHKLLSEKRISWCHLCLLRFSSYEALGEHKDQKHKYQQKIMKCTQCKARFPTPKLLRAHVLQKH